MRRKLLKKSAYILASMMLLETALMNVHTEVFSKETLSLEAMKKYKETAINWLKDSQNEDGSFGKELQKYNTAQFLENLAYVDGVEDERNVALQWLEKEEAVNNDELFRKSIAKESVSLEMDDELKQLQNKDGGFGLACGYKSDVLDTVLGMNCLMKSESDQYSELKSAMNYLKKAQMEDGSFSFSEDVSSVYLTAYTYQMISCYLNENADSSVKEMAKKSEEYLRENEEDDLWGITEDTIRNSLMSSIALVSDDDDTRHRIATLSERLSEDGSMLGDVELTSLYVRLINEYEIATGNFASEKVIIRDFKISADKERIGAYTWVRFDVTVLGMKENQKLIAVVSGEDGKSETLTYAGDDYFLWNTENHSGTFDVMVSIIDKKDGMIIAEKTKKVKVYECFDITAQNCDVSPKAYKIGCGKNIKINSAAYVLANVNQEVTSQILVTDSEGLKIYEDSKTIIAGKENRDVIFDTFMYQPEAESSNLLKITNNIITGGVIVQSKTDYIKVYSSEDENRIDVDYKTSDKYIYPTTENVKVDFSLQGRGLSETIKRQPMDIEIILDDSGSMSEEDWKKAVDGAKLIVENMQPEDRVVIKTINLSSFIGTFTNDRKKIEDGLKKAYQAKPGGVTLTYFAINEGLKDYKDENRDRVIFLLTDGTRYALADKKLKEDEIRKKQIRIYGVYLENEYSRERNEEATEMMEYLASVGNGRTINAEDNTELVDCVRDLLGDIFQMAGKDVELSMTIEKNIPMNQIQFGKEPDETVENDDSTTTIKLKQNYLSVGEDKDYSIQFPISNLIQNEQLKLLRDIKLTYKDENDETIELDLGDIVLDIVSENSSKVPKMESNEQEGPVDETVAMNESDEQSRFSHNKPEDVPKEQRELISGSLRMPKDELYVGENFSVGVKMIGTNDTKSNQIQTKIVLVNKENRENIKSVEKVVSPSNDTETEFEMDTDNLYEGKYIAILMAQINDEMTALDASGVQLKEPTYHFTVTPGSGGSVNIKNGDYKRGELIQLIATADEGYVFDRWTSDDITFETDEVNKAEISLVMPEKETNIKAVFVRKEAEVVGGTVEDSNQVQKNEKTQEGHTDVTVQKIEDVIPKETQKNSGNHERRTVYNGDKSKNGTVVKESPVLKQRNPTGRMFSPLTGDFETKDAVRIVLLIQCLALIVLCVCLKKMKDETSKRGKKCH